MTEDATAPQSTDLDADAIAAWLTDHPDFFAAREGLLANLTLPHASGDAVSLVERQLRVLRNRNAELHRRLQELTDKISHLRSRGLSWAYDSREIRIAEHNSDHVFAELRRRKEESTKTRDSK